MQAALVDHELWELIQPLLPRRTRRLLEARLKLLASLPSELRQDAARRGGSLPHREPRWFSRADESPFLAELAAAVSEQRRVSFE